MNAERIKLNLVSGTFWIVSGSWSSSLALTWARVSVAWTEATGDAGWDPDGEAEVTAEGEADAVTAGPADDLADWAAGDAFVEPQPATRAPAIRTPNSAAVVLLERRFIDYPDRLEGRPPPIGRGRVARPSMAAGPPRCQIPRNSTSSPSRSSKTRSSIGSSAASARSATYWANSAGKSASPSARPAAISRSRSGSPTRTRPAVPRAERRCVLTSPRG